MKVAFYHYPAGKSWWRVIHHKIVNVYTHGPYSHVELILEDLGNGRYLCASASARDKGVRIKEIVMPVTKWDIVEFDFTPEDLERAKKWFEDRKGAKYDYLAWLGFLIRPFRGQRTHFFCSEAVMEALGFIQGWRYDPNSMLPIILRMPNARYVQKGSVTVNAY